MLVRNKDLTDAEIVQRIEDQLIEMRGTRNQLEEQIQWCFDNDRIDLKLAYEAALTHTCIVYDRLSTLIT